MLVDTGTDDMFGHPQVLCMNLPEYIAKETALVLQKTYEEALLEATNEKLEDEVSDNPSPDSSSEWEDEEFQDAIRVGAINDVPGLPPALQLSSRIPMVKDRAKKITIDEKGKKKVDEVVSTVASAQGSVAYAQKAQKEWKSAYQNQEANGNSKMTTAGPAPKGEGFENPKPLLDIRPRQPLPETLKHAGPQTEKAASTSTAAILREEVQRLAAANPSMVSTMQPNPPQAAQQSKKRGIEVLEPQSVLAGSAGGSPVKGAQTTAPQPKQAQPANRPSGSQCKPGSTGSTSTFAAPAAANTPFGDQPNQPLPPQFMPALPAQAPAPPQMWVFTGRSGGPPTPNPSPKTQYTQPPLLLPLAPAPTTPTTPMANEGQSPRDAYTNDEFLHSYTTYRYGNMEAMTDYMERSLLHSCRRRDCLQAPGNQADGTFRFYRPPPALTFQRPYGPGLLEGPIPPCRREEGRKIKKSYYD